MVPRHRQHRPEADRCEVPGQRWRNATSGASQTRRTGDRRGLGRRHGAEPAISRASASLLGDEFRRCSGMLSKSIHRGQGFGGRPAMLCQLCLRRSRALLAGLSDVAGVQPPDAAFAPPRKTYLLTLPKQLAHGNVGVTLLVIAEVLG